MLRQRFPPTLPTLSLAACSVFWCRSTHQLLLHALASAPPLVCFSSSPLQGSGAIGNSTCNSSTAVHSTNAAKVPSCCLCVTSTMVQFADHCQPHQPTHCSSATSAPCSARMTARFCSTSAFSPHSLPTDELHTSRWAAPAAPSNSSTTPHTTSCDR